MIAAFFSNGVNMTREELVAASDALLHARKCPECERVIDVAKKLDTAFDEDPDAIQLSIERNTEELLTRLPVHRWATVAACDPAMQHDDVITYLLKRADAVSAAADMRRAADYTDTAASIAEKMYARGDLSPERVVEVLKDHSTHLRGARMYGAALRVLGIAESIAPATQEPRLQLAILRLCRAILFADSNVCRLDEAEELALACERDFEGRDPRRLALATFVRANSRRRGGDTPAALVFYRSAREGFVAAEGADEIDVAFADQGIATCLVNLGRAVEARQTIASARRIFAQHFSAAELLRLEWLSARADAIDGSPDAAIGALHTVARSFLEARLLDEWVRVRLDIVALILEGDPASDVTDLCESIAAMSISLDEREPNRSRRCTAEALEHLRQMALRRSVTAELAQYVRSYIASAESGRAVPFAPPNTLVM
ncbi:MAG TPA: hypothetical protein VLC46_14385 [Thermoanaerobaculia bacterium]|nr:hypothetical protein [Thermoanaerobaculia bacterium]